MAESPLPIAAHNCYATGHVESPSRLEHALAIGVDNIEIDLGWDAARRRLIVSHDGTPQHGVTYASLEEYLVAPLEQHWQNPRPDGAPHVLTIEFKYVNAEAVSHFAGFLTVHADWFSSAPKAPGGALNRRRLTVCLTGDTNVRELYDASVPESGEYLAFCDRDYGLLTFLNDARLYSQPAATQFCRFLSLFWGQVERESPALAVQWNGDKAQRLRTIVSSAHQNGYAVRFYTLNAHQGGILEKFQTPAIAHERWKAAAAAGADWIATDDYEEIVHVLRP